MKNSLPIITGLFMLLVFGTSCEAIGGIFKAGVWAGVLLVVVIVAIIIFVISKMSGKK